MGSGWNFPKQWDFNKRKLPEVYFQMLLLIQIITNYYIRHLILSSKWLWDIYYFYSYWIRRKKRPSSANNFWHLYLLSSPCSYQYTILILYKVNHAMELKVIGQRTQEIVKASEEKAQVGQSCTLPVLLPVASLALVKECTLKTLPAWAGWEEDAKMESCMHICAYKWKYRWVNESKDVRKKKWMYVRVGGRTENGWMGKWKKGLGTWIQTGSSKALYWQIGLLTFQKCRLDLWR